MVLAEIALPVNTPEIGEAIQRILAVAEPVTSIFDTEAQIEEDGSYRGACDLYVVHGADIEVRVLDDAGLGLAPKGDVRVEVGIHRSREEVSDF